MDMARLIADNEDVLDHLESATLLREGAKKFSELLTDLNESQQRAAGLAFCAGALFVVKTIMMNDSVIDKARDSLMREMQEINDARGA